MFLSQVEVRHFRNLTSVSLSPTAGLNILEGRNASGKTSFLEAIHMLALARSFRTSKTHQLVQDGFDNLLLFAELDETAHHRLGLQRFIDNRMVIRLDGETIKSRARLGHLLPLQLITPESLSLLTGLPGERRQYLDWMMFHVEPTFHETWSQYQRYLKQRNALLREHRQNELSYWTRGLIEQGLRIDAQRRKTVEFLLPHIQYYVEKLLPGHEIGVSYRQGWKSGKDLGEAVDAALESDRKQKFTGVGPHRADLVFSTGDQRLVDLFSRGQLKLMLCALKLAQLEFIKETIGKSSIVLIDDLPAELDADHRALLLHLLYGLSNQVFVTATDRSHLDYSAWDDVRVFHVEHGNIKEVV